MDRKLNILIQEFRLCISIASKFNPKPNDVISFEYNRSGKVYYGDFVVKSILKVDYNDDGIPKLYYIICIMVDEREVFARNCVGCYWHSVQYGEEVNEEERPCLECDDYKLYKPKYATLISSHTSAPR